MLVEKLFPSFEIRDLRTSGATICGKAQVLHYCFSMGTRKLM